MIDKSREEMINELKNGIVFVVFEKSDGTMRAMRATLKSDLLPQRPPAPEGEPARAPRKTNEAVIAVFDMEKNEFRSFRIDRIQSFTPVES